MHGKHILSILSLLCKSKVNKNDASVYQCISTHFKGTLSFAFGFSSFVSIRLNLSMDFLNPQLLRSSRNQEPQSLEIYLYLENILKAYLKTDRAA